MKNRKGTIILVSVLCLLALLLIGGILLLTKDTEEPPVTVSGDVSWYDENGKEFLITTTDQLYGLAELSKTHDFKGQTIKLGADIVINEGDASGWTEKAPERSWDPIVSFAGTFDGQDHTISGVYGNSIVSSLGLFTDTQKGCVIKNLKLTNSCFKNNNDMGTGSIIGVGGGVLENVYSDAVIVSSGKNAGGLIGCVKTKGENQIVNCWFDGTITMSGYVCSNVGGLVGAYTVEDAINTIAHCLSTADITCMGENVGGICGVVGNGTFLNLKDSMFTGTLAYDTNKYAVVGSVVGQSMSSASTIVNDTYTVDELANRTIGTNIGYQKGNPIAVGKNYLLGVGGYQWTTLDFENYWVVQKDGMPRLRYYTQATDSLDGVEKMVDISWYDQTGAVFELTNAKQLYGFAYLSRSYDFRGQTIRLGADITVNEGDASTWGENAPAYNWVPIAWYGSSLSQRFKGTFDGQGHTISGIYAKGTENITSLGLFGEVYHGAVVKNFKLVNSYFEGVLSADVRGPVGSVAGRLRGTIENVYSDAIVVNSAKNTGGIVGMVIGTGQNTISGCWFDGTIHGITRTGGILGGVYGNKGNIEATIEHCLNTGDIYAQIGEAAVGGICGSAETWSILYVDDCLNAGTFQIYGEGEKESTHIGTLVGTVTETDGVGSKAVVTHSYGVKEFYSKLIGWKHGDQGVSQSSMMYVSRDELNGYGGYQWTTLDFNNHWAARQGDVPVPVAFAPTKLSVSNCVRMVDYSWYDPAKSVYTVSTMQQLYAMARLWDSTNLFKGKTILLGADITLNEGNAADWAEKAPAFKWEPMKFNGTFDGQGHTVNGVYVKGGAEDNYVGFFHRIYQDGVVKNLKLTNSYIEGTMPASERGAVGSIAGRSNGIIDTVYSDAIVVNSARMTGGLVGMITGEGENQILNSWFDGKVSGINRTGGILGGIYGNKEDIEVTIKTCVNTGDIDVKVGSGDVGGICGIAETGGTLNITDCVNAGTFQTVGDDREPNTHIGSVFGSVAEKDGVGSHVVLNNVYGVKEFSSKLVGWSYADEAVSSTTAVTLGADKLTGTNGYQNTALDFDGTWTLNENGIPVPAAFGSVEPDASVVDSLLDYSWYDAEKSVYTITTPEQLKAFGVLCGAENDYFKGKTVLLGADITLANSGEANWTPVNFSGTFDGQGHAVSGLYVNSTTQYTGFFSTVNSGAVVKNLKLIDSYIEGNGPETRSGVGSIAGRNHGTIENVYSNAILKNSKQMTGGIVGMVNGDGENKIVNCWFDGTINSVGSTGGILGGSYGKSAVIENCLNTGKVGVSSGNQVGGVVGYVQGAADVTVKNSLNAGTLTAADGVKQMGAVVGAVHDKAKLTLENAYGVQEFAQTAIGYRKDGELKGSGYAARKLADIKGYGAYQWTTLDFAGGAWVLKKDSVPALGVFDKTNLDLKKAKTLRSYRWHEESAEKYVISTLEQMCSYADICDREDFIQKPVTLSSDTYVLNTVEELLAFNKLCGKDTDYFAGKTVKLGADITLPNSGEANWKPVSLKGTFDGDGHTVSGVYVKSDNQYAGFFHTVESGAVVKNMKLVNSQIEGVYVGEETRAGVGSIAGRNCGTIENVYSSAIVRNSKQMTGGIAGMSYGGAFTNCWFDGKIYGAGSTGGILGGTYASTATLEHCLNTGSITVETGSAIGGLCGFAQSTGDITILDSLNAGTLTVADGVKQKGAVVGAVHDKAKLTLEDAYGVREFAENAIGYRKDGKLTGSGYAARNEADIKGYGAYQWTTLDFEGGAWVLKKDAVPALGAFDKTDLDLAEAKKLRSYRWYEESAEEYVISAMEQMCSYADICDREDFIKKPIVLEKDEYVLSTEEQLLAFNKLCSEDTDYFSGKTVKLGADIVLSGGTQTTPNWTPVSLKGTFDGNGHTVSSVYVKSDKQYAGFFHTLENGAVVKNMKLIDSHIEGAYTGEESRAGVGSIVGRNRGTIEAVYSSAVVKNSKNMTGGIAGMSEGGTIRNCWFDGEVHGTRATGGILGGTYAKAATVEHCLNTGALTVKDDSYYVGGICGELQKASTAQITDCLNAGTLTGAAKSSGTIVGRVDADASLTITNAYGIQEFLTNAIGACTGTLNDSTYAARKEADIKGYGAYQWTTLDFDSEEPAWVLKDGKIPALNVFDDTDLDLEEAKKLPDYRWYDETADTYVLTTAEQVLGFNKLCSAENDYFKDKTVKLGADIALTNGGEPNWKPTNLSGTFDGQGHTLSGVYVYETGTYVGLFKTVNSGAVVKDLRLEDSSIEHYGKAADNHDRAGVGSIAGRNHGTIEKVSSNAVIKNNKQMTGGIVGMVTAEAESKITNCWFDGTIDSVSSTGGILGASYGRSATIEHCLNTGKMTVNSGVKVGGLVGYAQGAANVTVKDSLNAGELTAATGVTEIGAIIGDVHANGTVTLRGVYAVKEFAQAAIGETGDGTISGSGYAVRDLDDIKGYGAYQWTTLDFDGGTWVLKDGKIPALNVFDDTDLDLEEAKKLRSYRWYEDSADEYVIGNLEQMCSYADICSREDFIQKPIALSSDEYVLSTEEQLLAFNKLCTDATDYFKGKTVKLGSDIALTGGTQTTPNWTPVKFKGTLDGQGNAISGVYVRETGENIGFVSYIFSGATVKNLNLVDSYIEHYGDAANNRAAVGSIAGQNHGTIENVYSNAVLKNNKLMTGGIAGMTSTAGDNKIVGCWFDGTIYATGSTGGILGGTYAATATVEGCLNTGEVVIETSGSDLTAIGGLCGYAQSTGGAIIRNSLNAGTVELIKNGSDTIKQVGTIIGAIHANATQTKLNDVYGVAEFSANTIGYGTVAAGSGTYATVKLADIKGYGAYQWTTLDFDGGTWVLKAGKIPALNVFDDTDLDLDHAKTLPDYTWYDEAADAYVLTTGRQLHGYVQPLDTMDLAGKTFTLGSTEYVLGTAEQLRAFNSLCNADTDYFNGKTVKLGAYIALNTREDGSAVTAEDVATWGATAPKNKWTPIEFKGIFDGQGHKLSGLYVNTTGNHNGFFKTVHSGATVQNLKLINSYIEGAMTSSNSRNATGSVAGLINGTIRNVYSNAIVKSVNGNKMTGGIAGMVNQNETGRIINCWFDGTVYGKEATAGILGGAYKATVYVEHCLNTGTLNVTNGSYYAGGICGDLQNVCTTTITDCLNAGALTGTVNQSGTIVGRLDKTNSKLALNGVYGVSEFLETAIGKQDGSLTDSDYEVKVKSELYGTGAAKLSFYTEGATDKYWIAQDGKIPMLKSFEVWAASLAK